MRGSARKREGLERDSIKKVEGKDCGGRRTYVVVSEEEVLPRRPFLTIGPRGVLTL